MKKFNQIIFLIVFIEGAAVMGIELAGVKMIAPFYGTTLYVWAAVLSVTLGGLALGYFSGGRIASKFSGFKSTPLVLVIGAILVAIMPYTSVLLMNATSELSIRTGPLFSSLFFLMPPLICMGMISPIIIQLGTKELNKAGKFAGTVYAVSTVGGIIMTLLMGFYFLPEWGIRSSIFLLSLILSAMAVISYFLLSKKFLSGISGLILIFIAFSANTSEVKGSNILKVLYQSEGVLGQITVYDYISADNHDMRILLINGVPQTFVIKKQIPIHLSCKFF